MKARDVSRSLKDKNSGWVAINSKNQVVVSAATFKEIIKESNNSKEKLTLVPAAKDYSGFISLFHGSTD